MTFLGYPPQHQAQPQPPVAAPPASGPPVGATPPANTPAVPPAIPPQPAQPDGGPGQGAAACQHEWGLQLVFLHVAVNKRHQELIKQVD